MITMKGLLPETVKEASPTKYPRSSGVRFLREHTKSEMSSGDQTEWQEVMEFWGVETPGEFKEALFGFQNAVKGGSITVAKVEVEAETEEE